MVESPLLPQLLSRLEQCLTDLGAPVVRHWRPGADPRHVDDVRASGA